MSRLRPVIGCVLLAGLLLSSHPAAAQDRCAPYDQGIRVSTTILDPEPRIFHERDRQGMRSLFASQGRRLSALERHTVGVTFTEAGFRIAAQGQGVPRRMGGFCVYLDRIEAEFGYSLHEVHISNEFRRDSCEFGIIRDHENEHVSINRQVLRQYASLFRQELQDVLAGIEPEFAPSVRVGLDRAMQRVRLEMEPFLDRFSAAATAANRSIDTDESYAALSEACEFWGMNLPSPGARVR